MGNLDRKPIGKCSQCGGVVSVPTVFWSVNRPVPSCERCGAVADEAAGLPVIPTTPVGDWNWRPVRYRNIGRPGLSDDSSTTFSCRPARTDVCSVASLN